MGPEKQYSLQVLRAIPTVPPNGRGCDHGARHKWGDAVHNSKDRLMRGLGGTIALQDLTYWDNRVRPSWEHEEDSNKHGNHVVGYYYYYYYFY